MLTSKLIIKTLYSWLSSVAELPFHLPFRPASLGMAVAGRSSSVALCQSSSQRSSAHSASRDQLGESNSAWTLSPSPVCLQQWRKSRLVPTGLLFYRVMELDQPHQSRSDDSQRV